MTTNSVLKYNLFKGLSTTLSVGTPIVTLACCGEMFIHRSDTAISAAGVFAILLACLFFKDKIAEKFKTPSAFVLSAVVFVLVLLVENLMLPVKYVCIATMAMSGIDELTFKRFYKTIEGSFPPLADQYKHFGFLFTTTKNLINN